jgi:hypothetical protein
VSNFSGRKSFRLRKVRLFISDHVRIPAALGFFHPSVVLPAWTYAELPPNELKAVLLHELAHLQRWDDWTNLAQKFIKALFFFHPAVWWIENRLSLEREIACDELALSHNGNANTYAASLVSIAERVAAEKMHRRATLSLAQSALGRACGISLRLAQILDEDRPTQRPNWRGAAALAGALAMFAAVAMPFAPELVSFQTREQQQRAQISNDSAAELDAFSVVRLAASKAAHSSRTEDSKPESARNIFGQSSPASVRSRMYPRESVIPAKARTQKSRARIRAIMARMPSSARPAATLVVLRSARVDEFGIPLWSFSVWRITASNSGRQETIHELLVVSSI